MYYTYRVLDAATNTYTSSKSRCDAKLKSNVYYEFVNLRDTEVGENATFMDHI